MRLVTFVQFGAIGPRGYTRTVKGTNIPSFSKIGQSEMYDDILTIVLRFIEVYYFWGHVTASRKIFPPRFMKGRNCNTYNRFFIESKRKNQNKKYGSKPPINLSPIRVKTLFMNALVWNHKKFTKKSLRENKKKPL